MALEQRRFTTVHEENYEVPQQPSIQVKRSPKIFSPGEKFLFVVFATLLAIFSTVLLQNEGKINEVNREVQAIGQQIEQTTKQNKELSTQVKEHSTYDKILEKAKQLGLNPNESNVKVVPGR